MNTLSDLTVDEIYNQATLSEKALIDTVLAKVPKSEIHKIQMDWFERFEAKLRQLSHPNQVEGAVFEVAKQMKAEYKHWAKENL